MEQIRFLTTGDVVALHEQVMAASNQSPAALVRPEAMESAVHSARNLVWYNGASAAEVAVHITIHLALAHPWVDGNKRTAAAAGIMTARYNGARQATAKEALEFAHLLIRYVESDHDHRETALVQFVAFVQGWFPG